MKCRIIDYFSRIGKSRGFGIQSPWAYSFVTDVIMERLPYYAYERIDKEYRTTRERKHEKLMLRIRNFCHKGEVIIFDISNASYADIVAVTLRIKEHDALVVENIYASDEVYKKWLLLRDTEAIGITFDLYSMAICFSRDSKYKQHYKLNF